MLTRASQQLSVVCAGLLFWSSAPAAVYEITRASSRESLSLNADAFRGDTGALRYDTLNSFPPGLAFKPGSGNSGAGISVLGAIEHAYALGIRKTHPPNPGALLWNDSGHHLASRVDTNKNQSAVNNAGPGAPESIPEVWAMLLIGTGLVCYQLRRKSKVRLIRFTSN